MYYIYLQNLKCQEKGSSQKNYRKSFSRTGGEINQSSVNQQVNQISNQAVPMAEPQGKRYNMAHVILQ